MHVAVIGAGIVGAVSAVELQRDGHEVTIIEPGEPGGEQAVQLEVAEKAVDAFRNVANEAQTTLIVPGNMSEVSALIASAMRMVQAGRGTPPATGA